MDNKSSEQVVEPATISFAAVEVVPEDSLEAALFQIIDDISTAGDMFKPEIDGYFKYVQSKIESASKLIVSDGYKLFYASHQIYEREQ